MRLAGGSSPISGIRRRRARRVLFTSRRGSNGAGENRQAEHLHACHFLISLLEVLSGASARIPSDPGPRSPLLDPLPAHVSIQLYTELHKHSGKVVPIYAPSARWTRGAPAASPTTASRSSPTPATITSSAAAPPSAGASAR